MKRLPILLFFCIAAWQTYAQSLKDQFHDLVAKNDTAAQSKLLVVWRNSKPQDPELYVAFYNFWIRKSMTETINLSNAQSGQKSLVLTDPKTKKIAGYLNDGITYDALSLLKAFAYIDTGISKFPTRLDMRFGKIYLLGKIKDYDSFTTEIIKAVDYAPTINLKWTWAENKLVEDPKSFMLASIQDYVNQLYNAGDNQVDNMRRVATAVLKYYPDHVESLSNLSITYLIKEDYKNAIVPLLKAEKLAPTDFIVLNNIAYCYSGLKDKLNAIKYYELVLKYGTTEAKKQAQGKINELNKK